MGMNVSAEPIDAVIRSIIEQYERKPEGWRILTDKKGNMLVVGPNVGYRLKMIPINPIEYTGVGLKIIASEEVQDFVRDMPFYGFRPLQDREAEGLTNALRQEGVVPIHLVQRLLGIKPVSTSQLPAMKPKAILSGP